MAIEAIQDDQGNVVNRRGTHEGVAYTKDDTTLDVLQRIEQHLKDFKLLLVLEGFPDVDGRG